MTDDTIRLATIGRIFRRRGRLLAACAVAGALFGFGLSVLFPPSYTTAASVVMPGQWEEREILTQAQVATSSAVVDRTANALGWSGVSGSDLLGKVTAKAGAQGNFIQISGTAETPERAQRLADESAQQFVTYSARIAGSNPEAAGGPKALRKKVEQTSRDITDLAKTAGSGQSVESVQARTKLEQLRTALEEAVEKLDQSDPENNKASMVVMGPAARPTGEAPPTRTQLVGGGALLFVIAAIIGHLTAARRSNRLRTEREMAAALGSALLGTVDVPGERGAHRPKGGGARAAARRLLGLDIRWDTPAPRTSGDEASRRTRYRRVCARLRDQLPGPRRLLALVPEGDEIAFRAAGQLAAEAGSNPGPASRGYPALRVVEVPVSRPLVPDRGTESGALVVLSAGNWTAPELTGIAEACADAGHEVVGIVVAGAVRGRTRSAGPVPEPGPPAATAVGQHVTGGSA
ncbi:polysaccharide biosynthesis protein [Streptomyces boninensis]|uniref:polysaccharide biosynthesis protein n=1 Tax=Streptomyces boninensis TaxID=2039455 RepID=UPI003B21446F